MASRIWAWRAVSSASMRNLPVMRKVIILSPSDSRASRRLPTDSGGRGYQNDIQRKIRQAHTKHCSGARMPKDLKAWQARLASALDVGAVLLVAHEFLSEWTAEELHRLPHGCFPPPMT